MGAPSIVATTHESESRALTPRLKLDHLVYAVPDLAASIESFEHRLGQAPRAGGRHVGLGTHNAILPLANECYVELIAIDPDADKPNHPRPFGLDSLDGPRLVTWAVRSRSIESDVERARTQGYDPGAVLSMSRRSPSGELLEWKLTLRADAIGDGIVPFVIDWGKTPHPASIAAGQLGELELEMFCGDHPHPDAILQALDALNVEFELGVLAERKLTARIKGPRGRMMLN
jgi:hypothetical protein